MTFNERILLRGKSLNIVPSFLWGKLQQIFAKSLLIDRLTAFDLSGSGFLTLPFLNVDLNFSSLTKKTYLCKCWKIEINTFNEFWNNNFLDFSTGKQSIFTVWQLNCNQMNTSWQEDYISAPFIILPTVLDRSLNNEIYSIFAPCLKV